MTSYIGVDLGGTNTRVGLVDESGLVESVRFKTKDTASPGDLIGRIVENILKLKEVSIRRRLVLNGVGVACPGIIDRTSGNVRFSINLPGWKDIRLADRISGYTGLPTVLENDANLYAWGEYKFGAGRGEHDLLCFTLGTGVGGGLILNDNIYIGSLGFGAEFGHIIVEPFEGRACSCGGMGCLEATASATALTGMLNEKLSNGEKSILVANNDSEAIFYAALKNDKLAIDIFRRAGNALGRGIVDVVSITGVRLVILGGGLSASWPVMGRFVTEEISARFHIRRHTSIILKVTQLGDNAPLLGAAAWAELAHCNANAS